MSAVSSGLTLVHEPSVFLQVYSVCSCCPADRQHSGPSGEWSTLCINRIESLVT